MKVPKTKKRKMDIEEEPNEQRVDVNILVNQWLDSQKGICEVLLTIVNKITALEQK